MLKANTMIEKENGTIHTFSKPEPTYSLDEYLDMLKEHLTRENMVFEKIVCRYMDYWGYTKLRIIKSLDDVQEMFDNPPDEADAYFADDENDYKLTLTFLYKEIRLETTWKDGNKSNV